ncbi:hypothetical protein [Bacillus weihaiensis]|uniref:hypothetical protein n=1 Tax=Bacillus weihaiensis TaxID=1547283 RepID=UPI0023536E3D|nr:hypothetical protein [Bacillus weihaiensis]
MDFIALSAILLVLSAIMGALSAILHTLSAIMGVLSAILHTLSAIRVSTTNFALSQFPNFALSQFPNFALSHYPYTFPVPIPKLLSKKRFSQIY